MRQSKTFKVFLVVFIFLALFQLMGPGEAFCEEEDPSSECADCFTCPCHYFAVLTPFEMPPASIHEIFSTQHSFFISPQEPSFRFFRPPISA